MTKHKLSRGEFLDKLKQIKLFALDVDGVLTDDGIYFGPDGFEMKKFNISDGFFMVLAQRAGLVIAIVSGRSSAATVTRMKDLGIEHVYQGQKDKTKMLEPLLKELKLDFPDVAFIGNELLDIKLAERAGLSIAVNDSNRELIDVVDYVTQKKGGDGAVREVLECYFEARGIDPKELIRG
jgi:3-deoxy-D-manno-octulosonate 8-phosphate phosphatase (KDO 8-P phosphatase)